MENREISKAVITRLPRYYRYLGELLESGVERISSNELSTRMKVTASQIRQDLNNFGGFGQQGYGYMVEQLYNEIGHILGMDRLADTILLGAGNLGRAIVNHTEPADGVARVDYADGVTVVVNYGKEAYAGELGTVGPEDFAVFQRGEGAA